MTYQEFVNFISNSFTIFGISLGLFGGFAMIGAVLREIKKAQQENENHHFEWPKDEDKTIYYPETKPVAYHQPTNRCPYCGTTRTHFDQGACPKCGGPYEEN